MDGFQLDIVDLTVAVQHVVRIADLDPNLRRSCDQIATCVIVVRIDQLILNVDLEIQILDGVALGEAAVGAVFLCLEDVQQGGVELALRKSPVQADGANRAGLFDRDRTLRDVGGAFDEVFAVLQRGIAAVIAEAASPKCIGRGVLVAFLRVRQLVVQRAGVGDGLELQLFAPRTPTLYVSGAVVVRLAAL